MSGSEPYGRLAGLDLLQSAKILYDSNCSTARILTTPEAVHFTTGTERIDRGTRFTLASGCRVDRITRSQTASNQRHIARADADLDIILDLRLQVFEDLHVISVRSQMVPNSSIAWEISGKPS